MIRDMLLVMIAPNAQGHGRASDLGEQGNDTENTSSKREGRRRTRFQGACHHD